MSTASIDAIRHAFSDLTSRRWTRSQLEAAESAGLLEGLHYELVEGELIDKMGKGRKHINCHLLLMEWLVHVFGFRYVNSDAPIDLLAGEDPISEPEPDLIVLARPSLKVRDGNPGPNDIRLAVEVSDTSAGFDLTTKAGLYARAGIPEYWVLDVIQRRLVVHREPVDGRYASVAAYREGESVAPLAAPRSAFPVSDAFREQ